MDSVTIINDAIVPQRDVAAICFRTNSSSDGISVVTIDSVVEEEGLDIEYWLIRGDEYDNFYKWWKEVGPSNPRSHTMVGAFEKKPEPPRLSPLFSRRTNFLEKKTFELDNNTKFALVLNNIYSKGTPKTVKTEIKIELIKTKSNKIEDLIAITEFKNKMPEEVYQSIEDANDCFVNGHFRQCAVMLRRTLESAIRFKILQNGLATKLLQNDNGDELSLSKKLGVLLNHQLVSKRYVDDVKDIQWYGNIGAHGKMSIFKSDILNIEPKLRNFLTNLQLLNNSSER